MADPGHEINSEQLGEEGVEDMINLLSLTEVNLLKNIRLRYEKQLIYTYTGSILVAVNPYQMFDIYSLDAVKQYEDTLLGSQPPHLFAIGSASFQKMNKDSENQVIIISGESGAGKTESTKLLMQYLAAVNRSGTSIVTERILEANPLLESFGNAKTIRNDNSSRFGKYVELYFKGGSIIGAKTCEYLLEKSRIVTQAADERNYHVFYELLSGLPEESKQVYGLTAADRYYYLNQGGSCTINSKDDCGDFKDLQAAMEVLSFMKQEQDTIYKILAAVLHLGNIYFLHEPNESQQEGVTIAPEGSDIETKWVCHLLQLDEDWLREALTKKITEARQERLITPLNTEQAQDARDAVAKALYQRLFTWLVERVNAIVKGPEPKESPNQRDNIISIAILDIFGFEDFRINSFEQLCINYANESLQFYFNKHIFKQEQQEYIKERISWNNISFHDNQPTIDLIAKKPSGIIHILDDESNFPKGTDQSFLEKCHYTHQKNSLYEKPRMSSPEFSIKHYAGKVTYNVRNFLDKNRDTLRADVVQLLIQSKNGLISKMFQDLKDSVVTKTISKMSGLYVTMKPKPPTVSAGFHESLLNLIDNMSKCNPWFVRCIKPNNHKMPMMFEQDVVLAQLRYTGMLETIRIRKLGFPVQHKFYTFAAKYFVLLPHTERSAGHDDKIISDRLLHSLSAEWDGAWQIGISKVFLKEKLGYHLDKMRDQITKEAAVRIQRFSRGFAARRSYQRKRSAAITIQAGLRGWMQRSKYNLLRRGVVKAQAQYRMVLQRRIYHKMLQREHFRNEYKQYDMFQEKHVLDVHHQISQGKHQNKQQKDMSGIHSVTQLEIPRDLANIFRQLPDCYPVHSEEHNIVRLSNIQPKSLNLSLQEDINAFAFSKFVNVYFQSHKWRMKKFVITEPFLKDSDPKEAVAIFKLIMRFMYDTNLTERQQRLIGNYIVQKGLSNESLCDEIYVQLANQTWLNKDDEAKKRGWMLMAACLSCFPPSARLKKFLLKYVSDHGLRDYKIFCQHKLLQCLNMNPEQKRIYPPCLLEWKVMNEIGNMAAQGNFTDGESKMICHLEPWTTAEEFASSLLQLRDVHEGHYGWTMLLRDDSDIYEYAGYDYVMDLMSEMELEPDFPYSWSYFITEVLHQPDTPSVRRETKLHPHNAETARILYMSHLGIQELINPVPAEPRPSLDPEDYFKHNTSYSDASLYISREQLLSDSKLNKRKPALDSALSLNSILNTRYTAGNRNESSPTIADMSMPSARQDTITPISPYEKSDLPISTDSKLNKRYISERNSVLDQLSDSKLNTRYGDTPVSNMANGHDLNGQINGEMLNGVSHPYTKKAQPQAVINSHLDHTAKNQILRQKRISGSYQKSASELSDGGSVRSNADMDQWVDKVFDPVLTVSFDELTDAKLLEQKMKGGGDLNQAVYGNSPLYPVGFSNQPTMLNQANAVLSPPQPAAVVYSTNIPMSQPSMPNAASAQMPGHTVALVTPNTQLPVMPSQQGIPSVQPSVPLVQAAVPAIASQTSQVQGPVLSPPILTIPTDPGQNLPQANKQGQLQIDPQTVSLQAELQQKQLQNKILQESVQSELLKRQLKELQDDENKRKIPQITHTRTSAQSSSKITSHKSQDVATKPTVKTRHVDFGQVDESCPGGVQTLKRSFEKKLFISPGDQKKNGSPKGVQFSENVETIPQASDKEKAVSPVQSLAPPLPPSSPPSSLPSSPPPPPSSPPPSLQQSEDKLIIPAAIHSNQSPPQSSSPTSPPQAPPFSDPLHVSPSHSPPPASLIQPAKNLDMPEVLQNVIIENMDLDSKVSQQSLPPSSPPPPPPPPPSILPSFQPSTAPPPSPEMSKDLETPRKSVSEVVRIGKIQWPPPQKEKPQKEVHVGKLLIQESPVVDETAVLTKKKPSQLKLSNKPQESKTKSEAPQKPKVTYDEMTVSQDEELPVRIDMKERRETLARQLSSIKFGEKNGEVKPKRKPLPSVVPLVLNEPKKEPPEPLDSVIPVPEPDSEEQETPVDVQALEQVHTHLYQQITSPFFMYNKVNWSLEVRKELFTPHEKWECFSPVLIKLIFAQIVNDVYAGNSIRITKDMRVKARNLLGTFGVTPHTMLSTEPKTQLRVIEEARDWPCYFSRIFAATGGQRLPLLNYVAVSHSGVYLLRREKDLIEDILEVIDQISFENIVSVVCPQPYTVQIQGSTYNYIIIYTHKADELRRLIDAFCIECEKTEMYVRAKKSYLTRESTLLSFEKGEVIKLTNRNMTLDRGWLYGSLHGRAGLFPHEYIESVPIHEVKKLEDKPKPRRRASGEYKKQDDGMGSIRSTSSLILQEGTFTMLEFAMKYFRKSPYRYQMARGEGGSIHGTFREISLQKMHSLEKRRKRSSANKEDWTWKEQVDMIKWTKSPIQISLLDMSKDDNKIALECFINIMRYMGDYPMTQGMEHATCLLFVLLHCHNKKSLIDEVFCQLIKQTTNNRSTKSDSEVMGWRFLMTLTSFFDVSDTLRPYFYKYLETVAYDNSRSAQGLAALCLENARKSSRYGGRKNVPSRTELEAIIHGRTSRRQMCVLPGGSPVVVNLKTSFVVGDVLERIAAKLEINNPLERTEYTLFYVIEKEDIFCPLAPEEYMFDIITELENNKKVFYILFQRTSWMFPLHLDTRSVLYIDVMYRQCLPDYLDGYMFPVPNKMLSQPQKDEISLLGAVLLCTMEKKGTPNQKDIAGVIPVNVQSLGDMKISNWSNQVHHKLFEVKDFTPDEAKIKFLEEIQHWPLFGSTFFPVKSVSDDRVPGECRLAINKRGISCLNTKTNETLVFYPLQEIISTRLTTTDKGKYLDIRFGNLMHQKIVRMSTEQRSDISSLINQYILLSKELPNM